MKHLLTLIALVVLLASTSVGASAQQTPSNTVCNEKSGLAWDMNTEKDLAKYKIYVSNSPIDPTADNAALVLMEINHTPPLDSSGVVSQKLNTVLSEGDKYFRVSAVDTSDNESPLSNEIGCDYNISPMAPGNVQIILKLAPPAP